MVAVNDSRRRLITQVVLWAFAASALFYLLAEHRAHFFSVLVFLVLLACPLMHLFMHHGHGDQSGSSSERKHEAFRRYLSVHPYDESNTVYPIETGEWQDVETDELLAPGRNPIVLRGESLLTPDLAEYPLQGISLSSPPRVCVFELCRWLAEKRRDQVLAAPIERRACVPESLRQILQLEEWHHPDLASSEPPSSTEAFRMLADVLVFGEPSRYVPTVRSNTHWKNWPDGGTL